MDPLVDHQMMPANDISKILNNSRFIVMSPRTSARRTDRMSTYNPMNRENIKPKRIKPSFVAEFERESRLRSPIDRVSVNRDQGEAFQRSIQRREAMLLRNRISENRVSDLPSTIKNKVRENDDTKSYNYCSDKREGDKKVVQETSPLEKENIDHQNDSSSPKTSNITDSSKNLGKSMAPSSMNNSDIESKIGTSSLDILRKSSIMQRDKIPYSLEEENIKSGCTDPIMIQENTTCATGTDSDESEESIEPVKINMNQLDQYVQESIMEVDGEDEISTDIKGSQIEQIDMTSHPSTKTDGEDFDRMEASRIQEEPQMVKPLTLDRELFPLKDQSNMDSSDRQSSTEYSEKSKDSKRFQNLEKSVFESNMNSKSDDQGLQ